MKKLLILIAILFMTPLGINAEETFEVKIPVKIEGGGTIQIEGEHFLPEDTKLTVVDDGFLVLHFDGVTSNEVYEYKLSQIKGNDDLTIYDETEYKATVYFIENEDMTEIYPVLIISIDGTDTKPDVCEWKNTLIELEPAIIDPPIKKVVSGKPNKDEPFTFKMVAHDKSFPMPEGSVDGVKTHTLYGEGEFEFGEFPVTEEGVYSYTIYEINEDKEGWTFDTSIYTITFNITREGNKLVARQEILRNEEIANEVTFTNIYESPEPTIVPSPTPKPVIPDIPTPIRKIIETGEGIKLLFYSAVLISTTSILFLMKRRKDDE